MYVTMMKKGTYLEPLRKWKSMCSISDAVTNDMPVYVNRRENCEYRRSQSGTSDSSAELAVIDSSESEELASGSGHGGGGAPSAVHGQPLLVLEQKIDRLNDMFLEQCRLLTTLKEDIRNSKLAMEKAELAQSDILVDIVKKTVIHSYVKEHVPEEASGTHSGARSLLDAIEARQRSPADQDIWDALASFLQSDELKEEMVSATVESVRGVIGECLSRDLASLYLPMLEYSYRRLLRQISLTVDDGFKELEANSACLSRSVYRITRSLRRSIERHQSVVEAAADPHRNLIGSFKATLEESVVKELQQWRQKVVGVFSAARAQAEPADEAPEPTDETPEPEPESPHQPLDPHLPIIDQMMMAAEIVKQIEAGDVNEAFERALNEGNLSLVTAACRGGERAAVFSPRCRLQQHVLLALLQQLSTDMSHDTQLKCRYLEDTITNLDANDAMTRAHLPLVVGEVRKHLTKFLAAYPCHVASRRVALIVMAADNLLK